MKSHSDEARIRWGTLLPNSRQLSVILLATSWINYPSLTFADVHSSYSGSPSVVQTTDTFVSIAFILSIGGTQYRISATLKLSAAPAAAPAVERRCVRLE